MAENYYFLVAGLPEADIHTPQQCPAFPEFASFVKDHLSPSDKGHFEKIQLTIDIPNLAALMEKRESPFTEGGAYDRETLEAGLHDPHTFPAYMAHIVEAWRQDDPVFHNITWEDQLHWLFYEAMEKVNCRFLRKWFAFEVTLNNLLAVLSCSEFDIPIERRMAERIESVPAQAVITRNEAAEAIVKGSAPDFSLPPIFPPTRQILALDRNDIENFEKTVDRMRWDWLDEETALNYFNIDFILAYGLKLRILDRWKTLTPEAGRKHLDDLLLSLESACDGAALQEVTG